MLRRHTHGLRPGLFFYWFLAMLLASVHVDVARAVEHPCVMVTEADYERLRSMAEGTEGIPWAHLKSNAINYITHVNYDPSADFSDRMELIVNLTNCGALAYILDPDNSSLYVNKLKTTLSLWEDIYAEHPYAVDCAYSVQGGSAFMCSVLALDIIHDDLTPQELTAIEAPMQNFVDWVHTYAPDNWPPSPYAVYGVWNTYKGDPSAEYWNDMYREAVEDQINADGPDGGIYTNGVGYAWARYAGTRMSKAYYMDVLTATSEPMGENDFYNNPKEIAFNEWLYGGAWTPLRRYPTFGDTEASRWSQGQYLGPFRAGQFSELAGQNAAYFAEIVNRQVVTGLLSYIAMDPSPEPVAPKSRIWASGYAAFWQNMDSWSVNETKQAMASYLWCPEGSSDYGHAHKDINAIHLTGYGENLLFNSGYAGWGSGISGTGWTQSYSWDWIHNQAESSNTVLLDGSNHLSKEGGGVDEGFTTDRLDYACGNSGPALDGTHRRNFIFVRPSDNANGYWILFDEIAANPSKQHWSTQVLLHPNAKTIDTVTGGQEYRATIDGLMCWGDDVALTMFLGTAPTSVTIKKGGIGAADDKSFEGEYLYSNYALDGNKKEQVVTVLFPEDATHAKATMARIQGSGYTGARITQGDVVDYAIESDGANNRTYNGVTFRGLATMYRMDDGVLDFFFVRKGRLFDDGQAVREGFSADNDISLFIDGAEGSIISPGTNVTFYYDNIFGLFLDGSLASVIASGENWVEVMVPEGTWECRYDTAVPGDANRDGVVDGSDATIMAQNWQYGVGDDQTADWSMGDFNYDGAVDGSDATILAQNWQYGILPVAVPEPGCVALILTLLLSSTLVPASRYAAKHRRA